MIDQNNRIIQAVTYMDAEQVFRLVSITQSKICFANGETLDLLINNQIEVDPRAINQLNRESVRTTRSSKGERTEEKKNDLEEIMKVTKEFDTNKISRTDYLKRINGELQKYQMIAREEIAEVRNDVMQKMSNMTDDQKKMFEDMSPPLAFRMRTVLKGASTGDLEAAMKIAESQNVAADPLSVADCVEIVKLHFAKETKAFELEKAKIDARADLNTEQKKKRC
ncbi:hypothetical protein NECAME_08802 [Necator americanus]|uniref:Uncharacterized protein n=1 Tax=Necator americanus TaxID=51031 RepID=W2TG25_NECAM|nr:hypothetical protein NECAME_08802 [Necator americanus]ETN81000.1 hypothetical protein NECAME_08802 [Necator americanus]